LISKVKKTKPVNEAVENYIPQPALENIPETHTNKNDINNQIEFIKLGEKEIRLPEQVQKVLPQNRKSLGSRNKNRPEIIKIAKTMLNSGATFENIKKVLPVSDAELSLLKLSNI
jgi:hypothetical protein